MSIYYEVCLVKVNYHYGEVYWSRDLLSNTMAEITADSTIYDLLKAKPESSEVLFKFGMGCVGCAIARGETIREAAEAHGIPLPELLSALGIKE
jgi:hybrid cluster-associated redox disulfide protein